ncbi:hypothetical protein [uncultured Ruthenibacterium sp.]|uniref:hypothetical protein n=1 Tax=uncultured Ruthenibacterium sp. TaxID=1905347 RepID=UPI00349EC918
MNLNDQKITGYATGIAGLPDKIENKAQWLKQQFDSRTDNEVKEKHNALIDALTALSLDTSVHSADVKVLRLNGDGQVEISTDGENFETISSSGHRILGPDGTALPQRGKLKFTGDAVLFDDAQANTTEIRALKGEKGDPGVVVDLDPGLFSMYVDAEGCLRLVWRDGNEQPPLRIENDQLIYTAQ